MSVSSFETGEGSVSADRDPSSAFAFREGTANFEAMREWNRATIYRKTIGYFADQLVGR